MAISFPRAMLTHSIRAARFEPQQVDYVSPELGGSVSAVTAGIPLWTATYDLAGLSGVKSDEWRAWINSLGGAQRPFIGRDVFRPRPRAYWGGFVGGFTGACTGWSQAIAGDGSATLTLALPTGTIISPGDYVDFRWQTVILQGGILTAVPRRGLARFLEGVTATAGTLTAAIHPAIPNAVPSYAVAHLDEPGCIMRLSAETSIEARDQTAFVPARIMAVQDFRE